MFQFQTGSIKRRSPQAEMVSFKMFQFQTGSIKRLPLRIIWQTLLLSVSIPNWFD